MAADSGAGGGCAVGGQDASSIAAGDLVASDLIYPDRTGEIYYVKYNPDHKWFYVPAMRNDEVLLIKCYDSIDDGRARFVPHSAFVDPTTPGVRRPARALSCERWCFTTSMQHAKHGNRVGGPQEHFAVCNHRHHELQS